MQKQIKYQKGTNTNEIHMMNPEFIYLQQRAFARAQIQADYWHLRTRLFLQY